MTNQNPTTPSKSSAEQRRQAVRRLPTPQPGLVVKVPLALLPLYMELHQIEPKQYRIETQTLIMQKQEPA